MSELTTGSKLSLSALLLAAACAVPQQRPAAPNAASINSSGAAAVVHQPASRMRCEFDTVERGPMVQGVVVFDEGDGIRTCTTRGQESPQPQVLPTLVQQMTNSALQTAQWEAQNRINTAISGAIRGVVPGY